jgi:hypothetical protein
MTERRIHIPDAMRALLAGMRMAVLPERKEVRHVVHGPDISG